METYIGGCAFDFRQDTSMVTLTMQNIPEDNLFDISFVSKKIGKNVRKIKFAVWSKVDGQDDLKWYEAVKNTSENKWSARVYTTDHKNNSGVYYVHAYGVLENGGTVCLKTAETTILTDYMPSVKTQAIQVAAIQIQAVEISPLLLNRKHQHSLKRLYNLNQLFMLLSMNKNM